MDRFQHLQDEVIPMKAWRLIGERECGYWLHVGRKAEVHDSVVDGVPHRLDGEYIPLSANGNYTSVQLPGCGYKELFHRQLYQDLTNSELPEGVDIHHKDGNPVNNMAKNLKPLPRAGPTIGDFTRSRGKKRVSELVHADAPVPRHSEQSMPRVCCFK